MRDSKVIIAWLQVEVMNFYQTASYATTTASSSNLSISPGTACSKCTRLYAPLHSCGHCTLDKVAMYNVHSSIEGMYRKRTWSRIYKYIHVIILINAVQWSKLHVDKGTESKYRMFEKLRNTDGRNHTGCCEQGCSEIRKSVGFSVSSNGVGVMLFLRV